MLIVEDIVDTGKTLKVVKEMFYTKGADEVKIVTLLDKPEGRLVEIEPDWCGFITPNETPYRSIISIHMSASRLNSLRYATNCIFLRSVSK